MRANSVFATVAVFLGLGVAAAQVIPEVIYGDDDRLDVYQVEKANLRALARSTVGLFSASDVTLDDATGVAALKTDSYRDSYNLCPDEEFVEQRTGAFCSGSLIAPDLIMTAGHCVRSEAACRNTKFVFGFAIESEGAGTPSSVPAAQVYGCSALVGREEVGTGADWALVRLDRPVTDREPLLTTREDAPAPGLPLVVIGHPAGLPTKIAGGASVRDPSPKGYFTANLDTYGGNSGSAVFNAYTGDVVGILVRGEQDYEWDSARSCRKSKVCPAEGCRGEDVTKVSAVKMPAPAEPSWMALLQ